MVRIYGLILFIFFNLNGLCASGQVLVKYEASGFSGEHHIYQSSNKVTTSNLTFGSTGSSSSCGTIRFHRTRFNYNSSEEAFQNNAFAEFSLKPGDGYYLVLSDISATHLRRSATGPEKSLWAFSLDKGKTWHFQSSSQQLPLTDCGRLTQVDNRYALNNLEIDEEVIFRFLGWEAESAAGIMSYSEIIISGSIRDKDSEPLPAPTSQSSSINFLEIDHNSMKISWEPGNGEGRIVIINELNEFTDPENGHDPIANHSYLGDGEQVVYNGSGTEVTVTGLNPYTHYWFRIFEYNNYGSNIVFRTNQVSGNPNHMHTDYNPACSGDDCEVVFYSANSGVQTMSISSSTQLWSLTKEGEGMPYSFGNPYATFIVQDGHKVIHRGSGFDLKNLIVKEKGEFLSERQSQLPVYINVFGDIICDGKIGQGIVYDDISFGFEDGEHKLMGRGVFSCSRIRKNNRKWGDGKTSLSVETNVILSWSASAAIYNARAANDSYFDIIVQEDVYVKSAGDISIDGAKGGAVGESGGSVLVLGLLETDGVLYLSNQNELLTTQISVGGGGRIICSSIDCSPSGSAGSAINLANGAVLELKGAGNPFLNFSYDNNKYLFDRGSTIEYSSIGDQGINPELIYQNLKIGGEGKKEALGDLVIDGHLILKNSDFFTEDQKIILKGNIINEGKAKLGGKVVLNGAENQQIFGKINFIDLEVNNPEGVGLEDSVEVSGVLFLLSGNLLSDGKLTVNLTSGAISGDGEGGIIGNISVKKEIARGHYIYFSAPLQKIHLEQVDNSIRIGSGTAANFYWYDESVPEPNVDVGWHSFSDLSTELLSGLGYALYLPKPQLLEFTGHYEHKAVHEEILLPNTPSGDPEADGWHLMGNPYPSAIDFDSEDWMLENIGKSIYIYTVPTEEEWYQDGDGYWNIYIRGGVEINGGSRFIGSMQGFWVKATNVDEPGRFRIPRQARSIASNPPVLRRGKSMPYLKLSVGAESGGFRDETVVRLSDEASYDFDPELDSYKFLNSSRLFSLYSLSGEEKLSVNTLSNETEKVEIPLEIYAPIDGVFSVNLDTVNFLKEAYSVILEDRYEDVFVNILEEPNYSFEVPEGICNNRFYLHLAQKKDEQILGLMEISRLNVEVRSYNGIAEIILEGAKPECLEIFMYDISGVQQYYSRTYNPADRYIRFSPAVKNGIYLVKVVADGQLFSGKVFLDN